MKITRDENHKVQWHFAKKELVALLSHMGTDDTRREQYGLALDAEHGRAYATDGHRAIVCKVETVHSPENVVLVRRDTIASATVLPGSEDIVLTVGDANVKCARGEDLLVDTFAEVRPLPLNGSTYHSNTTGARCEKQGFCGAYLADLGNVVKACPPIVTKNARGKTEKRTPAVEIRYGATELDPWIAVIESPTNETKWTVYLMPCRI